MLSVSPRWEKVNMSTLKFQKVLTPLLARLLTLYSSSGRLCTARYKVLKLFTNT
jgi:hypothetical protein